jgi:hypothetical protein
VSLLRMGSLVIDVNGRRLDAVFLRETGAIDDHFTIAKGAAPEPLGIAMFRAISGESVGAFKSEAGALYQVEATTELGTTWTPLGQPITATGATTFWTNSVPAQSTQSYFRVRQIGEAAP